MVQDEGSEWLLLHNAKRTCELNDRICLLPQSASSAHTSPINPVAREVVYSEVDGVRLRWLVNRAWLPRS